MTSTTAPEAIEITDEQKAEWSAMHERLSELYAEKTRAAEMAAHYLEDHVEAGAMTPGGFGLPSPESLDHYRRACEYAATSRRAWGEWQALHAEVEVHPYAVEVKARVL